MPASAALYDYVLVGGGLQSGLLVLALRHLQPGASIAVVEAGPRLAGNHTWCLHRSDVSDAVWRWLQPAVRHRWPGYRVAFAGLDRRVALEYAAIPSDHFAQVVQAALASGPGLLRLNTRAISVDPRGVQLEGGERLEARVVVDARGADSLGNSADTAQGQGWQKFVGLEIATASDHGLQEPLLMDARGEQLDGLRFLYVLPLGPRRLLVEDTCFSDTPDLDRNLYRARVRAYAAQQGWQIAQEFREEAGVLPMPWQSPQRPGPQGQDGPALVAGLRGGWFHPLTGYSLPESARLAQRIAEIPSDQLDLSEVDRWRRDLQQRSFLARTLAYALFRLAPPERRAAMLERFYRRPDVVIARFYGLQRNPLDAWRILAGAPPAGMRWWPRPRLSRPPALES
jgi:lycopene beta-cyclase